MIRRAFVSGFVALSCLAGAATAAGPTTGKVVFRNYSSLVIGVGIVGDDTGVYMPPGRGRATFKGVALDEDYAFGFDLDLDGDAEAPFTYNLNGNRKGTITIGDFGVFALQD